MNTHIVKKKRGEVFHSAHNEHSKCYSYYCYCRYH